MNKYRKVTQGFLDATFDYNDKLGMLTWKKSPSKNVKTGATVGSVNPDGYLYVHISKNIYPVHRLVFIMHNGYNPENDIDHINRDKKDNRIENLREVSRSCNNRNRPLMRNNKSGIAGVYWCVRKKRWKAVIKVDGKIKYLGLHKDKIEAACFRFAIEQCAGLSSCNNSSSASMFVFNYLSKKQPLKL